jgi:hypothetical protein
MKKITLGLMAIAIVVLACKKANNDVKVPEYVPEISHELSYSPGIEKPDTMSYQYDNTGRVIKFSVSGTYETYEYSPSQVNIKNYETGELVGTGSYNLNANGLITDGSFTYQSDQHTEKFEYNGDGQLVKEFRLGSSWADTIMYTYTNGNMVRQITIYWLSGSKSVDTVSYDFYTDKTSTIEFKNYGQSFRASFNKNLAKSVDSKYVKETFYYESDNKNRIIKETVVDGTDTISYRRFEYTD